MRWPTLQNQIRRLRFDDNEMTQQELADLVGASRPKISIVLSEFIKRRAIYREGRRLAIVPSRLEELAQSSQGG